MESVESTVNPDPKGLIREAYRIDGIGVHECRSIFLDWALSLPDGLEPRQALADLLETYGNNLDAHPMTEILRAGLEKAPEPRRRARRNRQAANASPSLA